MNTAIRKVHQFGFSRFSSLAAVCLIILLSACEKNQPPQCRFLSPGNGSEYEKGEDVFIDTEASDPEGLLSRIEIFVDGDRLTQITGEDNLYYNWSTSEATIGQHVIKAVATDGEGEKGEAKINITILPVELSTPYNISIYSGVEQVSLYWTGDMKALSYTIYWTNDNSDPTVTSSKIENISDEDYVHTNLDPSKTYKYRIQAVAGESTSNLSEVVSATPEMPPLNPPENIQATTGTSTITLSWDEVTGDGITYTLERKESAGWSYYTEVAVNLSDIQFVDDNVETGKGYFYRVSAVDISTSRYSQPSSAVYVCAGVKTIFEQERNNDDVSTTLQFDTHYYDAEEVTEELDRFRIKGGYSGAYSIYSAASYRNFDADCFLLDLEPGDMIEFKLISGDMSGLWTMNVGLRTYVRSSSGNYSDGEINSFSSPSDTYTFNYSTSGTLVGVYLDISMWEDLINYGPYDYEIEITITRSE